MAAIESHEFQNFHLSQITKFLEKQHINGKYIEIDKVFIFINDIINYQYRPKELHDYCFYAFKMLFKIDHKSNHNENHKKGNDVYNLRERYKYDFASWFVLTLQFPNKEPPNVPKYLNLDKSSPVYNSHIILPVSKSKIISFSGRSFPSNFTTNEENLKIYNENACFLFYPWKNLKDLKCKIEEKYQQLMNIVSNKSYENEIQYSKSIINLYHFDHDLGLHILTNIQETHIAKKQCALKIASLQQEKMNVENNNFNNDFDEMSDSSEENEVFYDLDTEENINENSTFVNDILTNEKIETAIKSNVTDNLNTNLSKTSFYSNNNEIKEETCQSLQKKLNSWNQLLKEKEEIRQIELMTNNVTIIDKIT